VVAGQGGASPSGLRYLAGNGGEQAVLAKPRQAAFYLHLSDLGEAIIEVTSRARWDALRISINTTRDNCVACALFLLSARVVASIHD
jgi:hypothetical protein